LNRTESTPAIFYSFTPSISPLINVSRIITTDIVFFPLIISEKTCRLNWCSLLFGSSLQCMFLLRNWSHLFFLQTDNLIVSHSLEGFWFLGWLAPIYATTCNNQRQQRYFCSPSYSLNAPWTSVIKPRIITLVEYVNSMPISPYIFFAG
jgi:hypothetical protein